MGPANASRPCDGFEAIRPKGWPAIGAPPQEGEGDEVSRSSQASCELEGAAREGQRSRKAIHGINSAQASEVNRGRG